MDSGKLPVDFKVKGAKKTSPAAGFSAATVAFTFTLALFFINKFVWSPFKNDKRYQEAKATADLLMKFEEEAKEAR